MNKSLNNRPKPMTQQEKLILEQEWSEVKADKDLALFRREGQLVEMIQIGNRRKCKIRFNSTSTEWSSREKSISIRLNRSVSSKNMLYSILVSHSLTNWDRDKELGHLRDHQAREVQYYSLGNNQNEPKAQGAEDR